MKHFDNSAVSPVVGVMLMLVVTIIIAAVVSGFAGGLASDQSRAPQATLICSPVIESIQDEDETNWASDYPSGFEADNGLLFEHKGGDAFSLADIDIQVQSYDTKTKISLADEYPLTNCTSSAVTAYIMEIGSSDGFIAPGDKFMLYADSCRIDSIGSQISWRPENGEGGKAVYLDIKCEYKIIDRASNNVIQQGSFILR